MRDGRYFARLNLHSGWRAHVFLRSKEPSPGSRATQFELDRRQWQEWLSDPMGLLRTGDPERVIKDSATARVCRVSLPLPDGEALDVVCKHSSARNLLKRLQNSFRTSRPMLTWKRAHALLNRRIPTARPLAVVEKRCLGLRLDSIIITEYVEGACDLQTILYYRIRDLSDAQQRQCKRMITEALVTVLRRFHDCGFMHRDLKAQNILVKWRGRVDEQPRILLVDLDGIRRPKRRKKRAWLRALMRLNVSLDHCQQITRTDRLRFLKRYMERPGFSSRNWKPVWREISAMSALKRQKNNRNHRQFSNSF
jgi:serine/threonine protein kinase